MASVPASVSAEFTEPLSDSSRLEVYDPCGAQVDDGSTSISGYTMEIGLSSDKAGTFVVKYFALSTLDGHGVNGQFTFAASEGSPCPGSGGGSGSPKPRDPQPRGGDDNGAGPTQAPSGSSSGQSTTSAAGTTDGSGGDKTAAGGRHARHRKPGAPDGKRGGGTPAPRGARDVPVQTSELAGEVVAAEDDGTAAGMPLDGLIVALGLAAVIGFGGGRIYVGLVGGGSR